MLSLAWSEAHQRLPKRLRLRSAIPTHGTHENAHACRVGFYSDSYLDENAISSHVIYSETAMPVLRLLGVVDTEMGSKHLFDEKVY